MTLFYPAIISFDKNTSTYSAVVPDIEGCRASSPALAEVLLSITESAARAVLNILESGGRYPTAHHLNDIVVDDDSSFVNMIAFDMKEYFIEHQGRLERREVEIPRWLLTDAEEYNINLSNKLRNVLFQLYEDGDSPEDYEASNITKAPEPEPIAPDANYDVKLAYPAKFYPERDGGPMYIAEIPDLENQFTCGTDPGNAVEMAIDLASLTILDLIEKGQPIPTASRLDELTVDRDGGFVSMIAVDIKNYTRKWGSHPVKCEVEIPAWLANFADENKFNLSRVLCIVLKTIVEKNREHEDEDDETELPAEYVEKLFEQLGIDPSEAKKDQ